MATKVTPLATLVAVTVTPGSAPAVSSETRPVTLGAPDCADTAAGSTIATHAIARIDWRTLTMIASRAPSTSGSFAGRTVTTIYT